MLRTDVKPVIIVDEGITPLLRQIKFCEADTVGVPAWTCFSHANGNNRAKNHYTGICIYRFFLNHKMFDKWYQTVYSKLNLSLAMFHIRSLDGSIIGQFRGSWWSGFWSNSINKFTGLLKIYLRICKLLKENNSCFKVNAHFWYGISITLHSWTDYCFVFVIIVFLCFMLLCFVFRYCLLVMLLIIMGGQHDGCLPSGSLARLSFSYDMDMYYISRQINSAAASSLPYCIRLNPYD